MDTREMFALWKEIRAEEEIVRAARGRTNGIAVSKDKFALAYQALRAKRLPLEYTLMVRLGIVQRKAIQFKDCVKHKKKKHFMLELEVIAEEFEEMFNVPALSTVWCEKAHLKAMMRMIQFRNMRAEVKKKTAWRIACHGAVS